MLNPAPAAGVCSHGFVSVATGWENKVVSSKSPVTAAVVV